VTSTKLRFKLCFSLTLSHLSYYLGEPQTSERFCLVGYSRFKIEISNITIHAWKCMYYRYSKYGSYSKPCHGPHVQNQTSKYRLELSNSSAIKEIVGAIKQWCYLNKWLEILCHHHYRIFYHHSDHHWILHHQNIKMLILVVLLYDFSDSGDGVSSNGGNQVTLNFIAFLTIPVLAPVACVAWPSVVSCFVLLKKYMCTLQSIAKH